MVKRKKITITLREDLLSRIDKLIDKSKIRTRSHAIEYILDQSLTPKISKALILAGGKGIKVEGMKDQLPKSMLPIKGKPLLEYQIQLLKEAQITDVLILVGHLGEKIKYYFGDGRWLGVKITYLEQKKKNIGTAFALSLAKKFLENDPFLVMYGDTLLQIDLKDFIDFHFSSKTLATIALTSIKEPTLYGVVKLRGEKIVDFIEKPKEEEVSRVISAGVFAFEPEIFNFLPPKPSANLEEKVFPTLAKRGMLSGYLFEGKWFDVGTQEAYEKVLKEWD